MNREESATTRTRVPVPIVVDKVVPPVQVSLREKLVYVTVEIIFFLLTFWDMYFETAGVRGFDLIAFCLLPIVVVFGAGLFHFRSRASFSVGISIYFILLICFSLVNIEALNSSLKGLKTCLGVFLGLIFLNIFSVLEITPSVLEPAIKRAIGFHVSALFLQLIVFYSLGYFIDYSQMLGSIESRAFSDVFRATGFFQEPASYSITVLMLLTLRFFLTKRVGFLGYIALISCAVTFSLSGLLGAGIFFVSTALYRISSGHILLIAIISSLGVGGVTSSADEESGIYRSYSAVNQRIARMTDFETARENDGSFNARYSGIMEVLQDPERWTLTDFIGRGVSAEYHRYGSNGLAFLINAGGFLSIVLVFFVVSGIFAGENLILFPIFALCIASAPMWTTFFWWMWLGFLVQFSRLKQSK